MAKKYMLKKDTHDHRDFCFANVAEVNVEQLPEQVDLRPFCSPIRNQGGLGSCTANALATGLREYLLIKEKQDYTPLSRLFLYYKERELEDSIFEDSGATLRDGMKVLASIGVCPEQDMPYDEHKFTQAPSIQAVQEANKYTISSYHRINSLAEVKHCLFEGTPVAMGMAIYDSFEGQAVAKTGLVSMPNTAKEKNCGGHAMLIVGYKKINGIEYLIVRNSWGTEWGDRGYCYIPSEFVEKGLIFDLWTGK